MRGIAIPDLLCFRPVGRSVKLFFRRARRFVKYACLVLVAIILLGNSLFSITRDAAFRNIDPREEICRKDSPWAILAKEGRDGVENDESRAVALGADWENKLSCALQAHL